MILFEYLAVGLAGYLLLFYLGWPLWTLIAPKRTPISLSFGAPVTGLAVLQIFSWYWLDHSGTGWSTGFPVLLGLNAVATVAALLWRRPTLRFDRTVAFSLLALVGIFAATSALFVSNFQNIATKGDQIEAASLGNNDVAAYAIVTRFVHDHDLHSHGPITGFDLGAFTRKDVFGVFPFVDGTSTITGVGDWQALLPAILVAMLLGVLALRDLANRLFPKSRTRAAIIALIASASFLFAYIQGQYFISQILAMPIAVALALAYFEAVDQTTRDEFFRSIAVVGVLDIVLAFTYPHMLFLAQPVLVGAVLLASFGPGWVVRARRLVVVAAAGPIVAAILVPERFYIAVKTFFDLASDTKSGFPLAAFTPLQLLGFQKILTAPTRHVLVIQAAIVFAVVSVAVLVLWRKDRRPAIFCAATVAFVLGSYGVIYAIRGKSYSPWKWVSFFQPLYTTLVVLVVCAAAASLLGRIHVDTTVRLVAGIVAGAVMMFFVVRDTRVLTRNDAFWNRVPTELSAIQDSPALAKITDANVALPPYWETMWAVYFLSPRTVYLRSKTYYPKAKAVATWTLEPAATPDAAGEVDRPLNAGYKLVEKAPSAG